MNKETQSLKSVEPSKSEKSSESETKYYYCDKCIRVHVLRQN